jgi:hypothetical protein
MFSSRLNGPSIYSTRTLRCGLSGVIRLLNVYKLIREPAVVQSASASSGNSATRSRAIENFSVACVWCTRGKVRFSRNLVVAPTDSSRPVSANSGHTPTASRTGQIDPLPTFKIEFMNGRKARESGLRLKA